MPEPIDPTVEVTEAPVDVYDLVEDAIVSAVDQIVTLKNKLASALAAPQASQAEIDTARQEAAELKSQLDAALAAEVVEDADEMARSERLTKLAQTLKTSLG